MAQHTIVALYRSLADAENACRQLEEIGIASTDIAVRAGGASTATSRGDTAEGERGWSFLDWLFGAEAPQSDMERYRTHLDQDGAALSIRADERHHDRIAAVLESTDLVAIEGAEEVAGTDRGAPAIAGEREAPAAGEERVLPTAREELAVGKREVSDTRNYRIRRYVIERPAEADVALHEERVVVERRAPADAAPGGEPFEEREVEVTERREEPVIGKRVVPGEEVVVRKEAQDRVETVRDKVRESKVEADRAAAGDKPSRADPKSG